MGFTDAILILISEVFVWGFFTNKHWARPLGLTALAGSSATALVFAIGTIPSGAWAVHPVQYGILCVLFAPIIGLFFKLIVLENN